MLVAERDREIITKGLSKVTEFTIKTDRRSFEILSSDLYTNNVAAILRELGTNAYDAHVEAGNDETFDVYLPNGLSDTFKIRDYGTGMTREKIEKLYSSYFSSDKTDSNDFVGCLGLGSKSPLSYTSNFSLVSYINNQKHSYIIFVSENGTPSLGFIQTEQTLQADGIEISFIVKRGDFSKFYNEANKIYSVFDKIPNLIGQDGNIPILNNISKHVAISKYNRVGRERTSIECIMGNVAYPIDKHRLDRLQTCVISSLSSSINNIFLYCQIGSLDITPSREALQYTDKTKQTIVNTVNLAIKEIKHNLEEDISNATTWLEASKILTKHKCDFQGISHNKQDYKWNNIIVYDGLSGIPIQNTIDPMNTPRKIGKLDTYGHYSLCSKINYRYDVKFIYADCSGFKKLAEHLAKRDRCTYIIIREDETLRYLLGHKYIYSKDILYTSKGKKLYPELFKSNKQTSLHVRGSCNYGDVSKFIGIHMDSKAPNYLMWGGLDEAHLKILKTKICIFVEINRGSPSNYTFDTLFELQLACRELSGNNKLIIHGVKKQSIKTYTKKSNWVELTDYIKQLSNKIISEPDFIIWYKYKQWTKTLYDEYSYLPTYQFWTSQLFQYIQNLNIDSVFLKYYQNASIYFKFTRKYESLQLTMERLVNKNFITINIPRQTYTSINDVYKKYRLLKAYKNGTNSNKIDKTAGQHIIEYIKWVDETTTK